MERNSQATHIPRDPDQNGEHEPKEGAEVTSSDEQASTTESIAGRTPQDFYKEVTDRADIREILSRLAHK